MPLGSYFQPLAAENLMRPRSEILSHANERTVGPGRDERSLEQTLAILLSSALACCRSELGRSSASRDGRMTPIETRLITEESR